MTAPGHDDFAPLLRPFWTGTIVERESLFLIARNNGPAAASLLFPPDRVLSITNAARDVMYEEGFDYAIDYSTGRVTRTPASRLVFTREDELFPSAASGQSSMGRRGERDTCLISAEGGLFHNRQVSATYTHRSGLWRGPVPSFSADRLPRTHARLERGEPITIAVMGDSISAGYSASGFVGVPPFQPPYVKLVAWGLEHAYRSPIALHNFAVGGSTADNGVWETSQVAQADPDLVIVAYGMNDAGYATAAQFRGNIDRIIRNVRDASSGGEFVLVAPMLPHPEWDYVIESRILEYRDGLARLADEGIAIADVTSVWSALVSRKSVYDLTGNGINHPNDFGHRIYAQVVLASLVQSPPTEEL